MLNAFQSYNYESLPIFNCVIIRPELRDNLMDHPYPRLCLSLCLWFLNVRLIARNTSYEQ